MLSRVQGIVFPMSDERNDLDSDKEAGIMNCKAVRAIAVLLFSFTLITCFSTRSFGLSIEEAKALTSEGVNFYYSGDMPSAIEKWEEALEIFKKIPGTEKDQADCLQGIGAVLGNLGRYEEDISKQEESLETYRKISGTEREQAGCFVNIGGSLVNLGRYEEAILKLEEALEMYGKIKGTERDQADCFVNIDSGAKSRVDNA